MRPASSVALPLQRTSPSFAVSSALTMLLSWLAEKIAPLTLCCWEKSRVASARLGLLASRKHVQLARFWRALTAASLFPLMKIVRTSRKRGSAGPFLLVDAFPGRHRNASTRKNQILFTPVPPCYHID